MATIRWKENKLFSIKLRNGKYALMQMLSIKGWVAVFNVFSENNKWDNISLSKSDVLFMNFLISKTIFPKSETSVISNLEPVKGLEIPSIKIHVGDGTRTVKIWEGTPQEREILLLGEGKNILKEENPDDRFDYKYSPIDIADYDKVKQYEMDDLRIYPEFNERLYLCSELNRNFDPVKELAFNRELDPICKTYIDIIGGKVLLSDLGY